MSLLNPSTETAVPIFPLLPKSPGESTGSLTNPSSNDLTNQSARLQGFNNHRALLLHNLSSESRCRCQLPTTPNHAKLRASKRRTDGRARAACRALARTKGPACQSAIVLSFARAPASSLMNSGRPGGPALSFPSFSDRLVLVHAQEANRNPLHDARGEPVTGPRHPPSLGI